jgi:hypothetical protein
VRVKLVNIHSGTGWATRPQQLCLRQGDAVARSDLQRKGDVIAYQAGWQDFQIVSSHDGSVGCGPASELLKAPTDQLAMELCVQAGDGGNVTAASADRNVRHLGNDRVFRVACMRSADAEGLRSYFVAVAFQFYLEVRFDPYPRLRAGLGAGIGI